MFVRWLAARFEVTWSWYMDKCSFSVHDHGVIHSGHRARVLA